MATTGTPARRLMRIICLLLIAAHSVGALSLSQASLNDSSYSVRHLSTHFSRVFLSLSVPAGNFATLVETQWPLSYLTLRTVIFPSIELHANGVHTDCTLLQQAHWTQVDSLSRLWVMDLGWQGSGSGTQPACAPKLLVFDLLRNNVEVLRIDCGQHIASASHDLVVQLGPKPNDCTQERHIYFVQADVPELLAYDILEQSWHTLQLLCHKYDNVTQSFPIMPVDFVFGQQGELLLSDKDGRLYSSVEQLTPNTLQAAQSIQLTHQGNLLGRSRSMLVDSQGAMFYVLPKFGAIVRCVQLANLTTEGNEVIYLTSKNIQQIFLGDEAAVWVLCDRVLKPQDICYPGLM